MLKAAFANDALADVAEGILLAVEALVTEANADQEALLTTQPVARQSSVTSLSEEATQSQMSMFLRRLSSPQVRGNERLVRTMTRILPFLTYGLEQVARQLVEHFLPYVDFAAFDASAHKDELTAQMMQIFAAMTRHIPTDEAGDVLRDAIVSAGIVDRAVDYLSHSLPASATDADELAAALKQPALPHVLQALTGLSDRHAATLRRLQAATLVPRLHRLEGIASTAGIGPLAETLLETMKECDPQLALEIAAVRESTEREKRERARQHRERLLGEVGVRLRRRAAGRCCGGQVTKGLEDIEEEKGCSV